MKYFQHDTDARTNRKLRKVLRTHGTTGYAIWWAVLEELYKSDDAGFSINADELWLETMAESLCISDHRTLIRVFDTFAEIGLISRQHWEEHYLFVTAIQERGDNYIQKKVQNAQRQERFRQKAKEVKKEKSRVSNALRNAENSKVTLSEAEIRDQIQKQRSETNTKEELDQDQERSPLPPKGGKSIEIETLIDQLPFSTDEEESEPADQNPASESIPVQQVDLSQTKSAGEDQSSAALPKKSRKKEKPQINYDRFMATYNEYKPKLFYGMEAVSPKRQRVFGVLVETFGSEDAAIDVLRDALLEASRPGTWCDGLKLKFENFASNDKIVSHAEAWRSQSPTPHSPLPTPDETESSAIAVPTTAISTRSNAPEGYQRWWELWTAGQSALGRVATGFNELQALWVAQYGTDTPQGIFEGTEAYIRHEVGKYTREGRSYSVGGRRFLEGEIWRDALTFEAHKQHLPESMTSGNGEQLKKQAYWAEVERLVEQRKERRSEVVR